MKHLLISNSSIAILPTWRANYCYEKDSKYFWIHIIEMFQNSKGIKNIRTIKVINVFDLHLMTLITAIDKFICRIIEKLLDILALWLWRCQFCHLSIALQHMFYGLFLRYLELFLAKRWLHGSWDGRNILIILRLLSGFLRLSCPRKPITLVLSFFSAATSQVILSDIAKDVLCAVCVDQTKLVEVDAAFLIEVNGVEDSTIILNRQADTAKVATMHEFF